MPADENPLAKALANTYQPESAASGWDRVQEYQRVLRYTAEHPQQGSQAVSTAVELPRERIRSWVDSHGKPDPVRAIQIADEHAWLLRDWTHAPAHGLNVLVAWIFSGGSISTGLYVPHFAVQSSLLEHTLEAAFNRIGLEYRLERVADDTRATEAVPTEHASILGRTLVAWGAPTGTKHATRTFSLPSYLWGAPASVRLDFARTYLLNRGHARHDRPSHPIQIGEERSPQFREELQALFRGVVDSHDAIRLSGRNLMYVYPDAADELFMPPTFGDR